MQFRWFVWIVAPMFVVSACRHGDGEPQGLEEARVEVDTNMPFDPSSDAKPVGAEQPVDPNSIDPRLPIDLDTPISSPIAELWNKGARGLSILEQTPALLDCESERQPESRNCLTPRTWLVERKDRKVVQLTCVCGEEKRQEKQLSASAFRELEARIRALNVTSTPAVCIQGAPVVTLAVAASGGEIEEFAVNYGQCTGSFTKRVDTPSFGRLAEGLNQVEF